MSLVTIIAVILIVAVLTTMFLGARRGGPQAKVAASLPNLFATMLGSSYLGEPS